MNELKRLLAPGTYALCATFTFASAVKYIETGTRGYLTIIAVELFVAIATYRYERTKNDEN